MSHRSNSPEVQLYTEMTPALRSAVCVVWVTITCEGGDRSLKRKFL